MKLRWIIPLAILWPLSLRASEALVKGRTETVVITPGEITLLHLRPGFISTIRMPDEVNSIALGSRTDFSADHSDGEPLYVYVRPITKDPAQSNLVIATRSGVHVTLQLISDGAGLRPDAPPVDFLVDYRLSHTSLIAELPTRVDVNKERAIADKEVDDKTPLEQASSRRLPPSELETEFMLQERINSPAWTRHDGQAIETSLGDIRQLGNRTVVAFSILNASALPVEIVPPQIQIAGRKQNKRKKKEGKGIIADQLEIRDCRLSKTRLEAGARADGVVVFDRPNFKQSSEKLLLQLSQANQVDRPVLIELPFTPSTAERNQKEGLQ